MGFWDSLTARFAGSREEKSNPAAQFIVAQVGGKVVWTPRDYTRLAETGYGSNAYVFAAVNERSNAVGGIPWKLVNTSGTDETDVPRSPLLDLMKRPNPDQGGAEFWAALSAYYQLAANSYTTGFGPNVGPPKELWNLRPDRTKVLKGTAFEPIKGYIYGGSGVTTGIPFDREQVMHLKSFHPTHDWYGMSPLEAGSKSIDASNMAKEWNVATLQNKGVPSGAYVFEGRATKEQKESVRRQSRDEISGRGIEGRFNAGRVMILDNMKSGGFKFEQFALTAQEMDWLEGQKLSAKEIAIVFNIPPELIGDSDSKTYSNYREARKAFYTENVLPFMDRLQDALNNWLTPLFGDNLELQYDKSQIEAIQRDRTELSKQAVILFSAGLVNKGEARVIAGLTDDVDDKELVVLPANLIPISGADALELDPPKDPEPPPKDPDEPEGQEDEPEEDEGDEKKSITTDPAAKAAFLKGVDRQRERFNHSAAVVLLDAFRTERKLVLKELKGATLATLGAALDSALKQSEAVWERQLKTLYTRVGDPFAAQVSEQLALPKSAKVHSGDWLEVALSFLETNGLLRLKAGQITEATRQLLAKTMAEGLAAGEGIPEISKRISEQYSEFAGYRATRIARTEVIAASNLGADAAAEATGLPLLKHWLTQIAGARETHQAANGQTVKKGEAFVVGSEKLMFPGDASLGAGASNIVNCRCTQTYSVDEG